MTHSPRASGLTKTIVIMVKMVIMVEMGIIVSIVITVEMVIRTDRKTMTNGTDRADRFDI